MQVIYKNKDEKSNSKETSLMDIEFRSAEEFLLKLKKEFERRDKKLVKVAKLKKREQ